MRHAENNMRTKTKTRSVILLVSIYLKAAIIHEFQIEPEAKTGLPFLEVSKDHKSRGGGLLINI
jgi:hypothetical protein